MKRLLTFIFAAGFLAFVTSMEQGESIDASVNAVAEDICSVRDVAASIGQYVGCLDSERLDENAADAENLAVRILEHSRRCLVKSTQKCRPDLDGFADIIGRVISQIKHYCHHYMEFIDREGATVKGLLCIHRGLSGATYADCFEEAFAASSEKKFRKLVESAISCTNQFQKQCSKAAKTIVNGMVRTILRVKQAEREHVQDETDLTTQSASRNSGETFRVEPRLRLSNDSGAPEKGGNESATDQTTESGSRNGSETFRVEPQLPLSNSKGTPGQEGAESATDQTTESGSRNSVDLRQLRTRVEIRGGKSTTEKVDTEDGTNRNAQSGSRQSGQAIRMTHQPDVPARSWESRPTPKPVVPEVKQESPKRWYDYIVQPFVSVWRAVRSFFGF